METLAHYYKKHNAALWRMARKPHRCGGELYGLDGVELHYSDGSLIRCEHEILKGEQYLDTYESIGSPFHTLKLCKRCAEQELADEVKNKQ